MPAPSPGGQRGGRPLPRGARERGPARRCGRFPPKREIGRAPQRTGRNPGSPSWKFRCASKYMEPFGQIVLVARVLAAPTRLALLEVLGKDGRCLTDAARMIGISPATACYHAHILVAAGLATRTVRGRRVIYGWPRSRWQLVRVRTGPTPATSAVPEL